LWGDWINTIVDSNGALYMVLAEGPICCVGTIALLIVILGVVLVITGMEPRDEYYDEEEYEYSEDFGGWEQETGSEPDDASTWR
jgi:hypothetical protein